MPLFNRRGLNIATAILTIAIFTPLIWAAGPIVERQFFPVTSKIEIVYAAEADQGTVFRFAYQKYRNGCQFVSMDWFTKVGLYDSPIVLKKVDGSEVSSNPSGTFLSSLWIAPVPLADFENIKATWTHRCHPLWPIRTQILP